MSTKLDKHDSFTKDDPNDADFFGPRPPPGYATLRAAPSQILLPLTVSNKCGQAFRWRGNKVWAPGNEGSGTQIYEEQIEWSLCLSDRVVLLQQDEHRGFLYHKTLLPSTRGHDSMEVAAINKETERWLNDYLNLDVPLEALYAEWEAKDPVFARFATRFTGLRMLRQDPWECLCAFVCSSNNNIARIGQMVQNLCTHFASPLLEHVYLPPPESVKAEGGDADAVGKDVEQGEVRIAYHPFPPPEALAKPGVEEKLRELGFGYRAKYLARTAQMLCAKHGQKESNVGFGATKKAEHLNESHWLYGIKAEDDDIFTLAQQSIPASPALVADEGRPAKKRARGSRTSRTSSTASTRTSSSTHSATTSTTSSATSEEPEQTFGSVRSYLQHLRTTPYRHARSELMQFPGVGPKVADCILLMSLDQASSIPVDRHVFQFAEKWYKLRTKKYEEIADHFRDLWGEYAGWAHSVLFTADLRSFANYGVASKREEKVEAGVDGGSEFWGEGANGYPTPPSSQSVIVKEEGEEKLQAVHSPPRVAIPELVPQSLNSGNLVVKAESDPGATLAERIKSRPKRKSRLSSVDYCV